MYKERLDSASINREGSEIIIKFQIRNHCNRKPYMFEGQFYITVNGNILNVSAKSVKQEGFTRFVEMVSGSRVNEIVHMVSSSIKSDIRNEFPNDLNIEEVFNYIRYVFKDIIIRQVSRFDSTIAIDAI